jgi:bifunctional non-homologous end joining protein LigD
VGVKVGEDCRSASGGALAEDRRSARESVGLLHPGGHISRRADDEARRRQVPSGGRHLLAPVAEPIGCTPRVLPLHRPKATVIASSPAMAERKLETYRKRRDFSSTPEPGGGARADGPERARSGTSRARRKAEAAAGRFVVQEHHATRLHWDLRLEHDGVLASWAIPNGIPPDPSENRLAVHTEDHPLEYLEFEGEIPKGEYGAGTMQIWDRGTYELHKWTDDKVEVTLHGERLSGRYGLFVIGRDEASKNDWMIHRMDPPADPDRQPMPERIVPMLARSATTIPKPERQWSFEVKWDGVRAIAYLKPGRLRLESRNLRDITDSYPEVRGLLRAVGMRDAVFDGELVAFDDSGRPSFERLQRRMHVTSSAAVRRLAASTPVVYAIFDVLYLDGRALMDHPYEERRRRLEELELAGPAWRVPAAHVGDGQRLLDATGEQNLEGVIAKRLGSRYEPGRRSGSWVKVKHTLRQELVIGGWMPGEGRRAERIGALLMGYYRRREFVYAGRVGTGFTEATLGELASRLEPIRRMRSPFDEAPKLPREAQFVEPRLVAEIEFREWTAERIMRAPSFKGLRDDVSPRDVRLEPDGADVALNDERSADPSSPEALFDEVERLPDGGLSVLIDGRRLKLTNWDKILFPQTGFTKGDLIAFYTRAAPAVIPHVRDRPLTLKRYPNGVEEQYFYEKQSPSHRPEWVATKRIGDVNYTLAQDRASMVWLANLADVELHTSLSLAEAPERPTMLVFDLDPGEPAGIVECCEVALVLNGLFSQLGLESFVKTSGSKGMQVYVPLNTPVTYRETKPFAKHVAELLEQRMPELVTSRMTKRLRPRKVLLDWSQNDRHKTTVTVYSVRARERPIVSTPVSWEEVARCRADRDPELLTFDTEAVLERVAEQGDPFAPLESLEQQLPSIG